MRNSKLKNIHHIKSLQIYYEFYLEMDENGFSIKNIFPFRKLIIVKDFCFFYVIGYHNDAILTLKYSHPIYYGVPD